MAEMDDRLMVEFLRAQAHESRLRASMTQHPEIGQRWLDLAREYDQQADRLEDKAVGKRPCGP